MKSIPLASLGVFLLIAFGNASRDDFHRLRAGTLPTTQPYGIDKRVPWTTSHIKGSPEPPAPYRIERVFQIGRAHV